MFVATDIGCLAAAIIRGGDGDQVIAAVEGRGSEPDDATILAGNMGGKAAVRSEDQRLHVDANPVGTGQRHERHGHIDIAAIAVDHSNGDIECRARVECSVLLFRQFRGQVQVGDIQDELRAGRGRCAGAVAIVGGGHGQLVPPGLVQAGYPRQLRGVRVEGRAFGQAVDRVGDGMRPRRVGRGIERAIHKPDRRQAVGIVRIEGGQLQAEGLFLDQGEGAEIAEDRGGVGVFDDDGRGDRGCGGAVADPHRDIVGARLDEGGRPFEHPGFRVERRSRRQHRAVVVKLRARIDIGSAQSEPQRIALADRPFRLRGKDRRGVGIGHVDRHRQAGIAGAVAGHQADRVLARLGVIGLPGQNPEPAVEDRAGRQILGQDRDLGKFGIGGDIDLVQPLALGNGQLLHRIEKERHTIAALDLDRPGDIGKGPGSIENPDHDAFEVRIGGGRHKEHLAGLLIDAQPLGPLHQNEGKLAAFGILDGKCCAVFLSDGRIFQRVFGEGGRRVGGGQGVDAMLHPQVQTFGRKEGGRRGRKGFTGGEGRAELLTGAQVDQPQVAVADAFGCGTAEIARRVHHEAQRQGQFRPAGIGHRHIVRDRAVLPVPPRAVELDVHHGAEIGEDVERAGDLMAQRKPGQGGDGFRDGQCVDIGFQTVDRQRGGPRGNVITDIEDRDRDAAFGSQHVIVRIQDRPCGGCVLCRHVAVEGHADFRNQPDLDRAVAGADRRDFGGGGRVDHVDPGPVGDQQAPVRGGDQAVAPCRADGQRRDPLRRQVQHGERAQPGRTVDIAGDEGQPLQPGARAAEGDRLRGDVQLLDDLGLAGRVEAQDIALLRPAGRPKRAGGVQRQVSDPLIREEGEGFGSRVEQLDTATGTDIDAAVRGDG